MNNRIKMKLDLTEGFYETYEDIKPVFYEMSDELAKSMLDSYSNSVDFEGDDLEDFENEISNVFKGLYGEFAPNLSSVLEVGDTIVGGLLLCIFKNEPTVTYLFTKPNFQRNGIAAKLLNNTCYKLLEKGYKELFLYLNLENIPAYNLFDSFGFNEIIDKNNITMEEFNEY
ncbi:GNAT family N-acetyltransferase [Miniphocaeibacter massiliensis]|uniref:GNAT family N-acetyltransferase n=1 Tax=Miniphocaeibacter massiliensis TaxID=2041841 RepID=UPI000C1C5B8C|nr:GNAT family N-acetyltransferase [Miniphocaeibacter massiliensis]